MDLRSCKIKFAQLVSMLRQRNMILSYKEAKYTL